MNIDGKRNGVTGLTQDSKRQAIPKLWCFNRFDFEVLYRAKTIIRELSTRAPYARCLYDTLCLSDIKWNLQFIG